VRTVATAVTAEAVYTQLWIRQGRILELGVVAEAPVAQAGLLFSIGVACERYRSPCYFLAVMVNVSGSPLKPERRASVMTPDVATSRAALPFGSASTSKPLP
jgi:hypothetical protein